MYNIIIKLKKKIFNLINYFKFRFIYCGNIELKNLQGSDVLKLLIAVDELNIKPLISHIQEFLIEHQTEFLCQNPTDILELFINMKHLQIYGIFVLKKFAKNLKFYLI